jgi:hypothetical protein
MIRLAAALCLVALPAYAQLGAPTDCSGTVGSSASVAITFSHSPALYVTVVNPNASAKLAINPTGAAVIDSSGSYPMDSIGTSWTWSAAQGMPPPATINIIASASSTGYTCKFQ